MVCVIKYSMGIRAAVAKGIYRCSAEATGWPRHVLEGKPLITISPPNTISSGAGATYFDIAVFGINARVWSLKSCIGGPYPFPGSV